VPSVVKVGNKVSNKGMEGKVGNKGMEGKVSNKVGNKVYNAVKFVYSLTWLCTACLLPSRVGCNARCSKS
jgi:hypothetical protein